MAVPSGTTTRKARLMRYRAHLDTTTEATFSLSPQRRSGDAGQRGKPRTTALLSPALSSPGGRRGRTPQHVWCVVSRCALRYRVAREGVRGSNRIGGPAKGLPQIEARPGGKSRIRV